MEVKLAKIQLGITANGTPKVYLWNEGSDTNSLSQAIEIIGDECIYLATRLVGETVEIVEKGKWKNVVVPQAYKEMLDGCLNYPENYIWYTLWFMELKDSENEIVGTLSFKGIDGKGIVEIGYGINEGYENKGYMTEAVTAMVKWASLQPNVNQIESEAEESNIASIRVLEKSNFVPNGKVGQEGIRFVWKG